MTGPTFNQNHSGGGNNVINFGKQAFVLTESILNELERSLCDKGQVVVEPHGVQESFGVAAAIVDYLSAKGMDVVLGGGIMMMMPTPSGPLELRGSVLLVDASK